MKLSLFISTFFISQFIFAQRDKINGTFKILKTHENYSKNLSDSSSYGKWRLVETPKNANILFDYNNKTIAVFDGRTTTYKIKSLQDSSVSKEDILYLYICSHNQKTSGLNICSVILVIPTDKNKLGELGVVINGVGRKYEFNINKPVVSN